MWRHAPDPDAPRPHHAYLGPVVERCGHPENDHGVFEFNSRAVCFECYETYVLAIDQSPRLHAPNHVFTEEPVAQSQERMG